MSVWKLLVSYGCLYGTTLYALRDVRLTFYNFVKQYLVNRDLKYETCDPGEGLLNSIGLSVIFP